MEEEKSDEKKAGFFTGDGSVRGSDQEVFQTPCGSSRVGRGGVGNLTGRIASGQEVFKNSPVGVGPPRPDPTREKQSGPWEART